MVSVLGAPLSIAADNVTVSNVTSVLLDYEEVYNYEVFKNNARFAVQNCAVPVVMVFGVIANSLSIIVLTRVRMQSSTNWYLAALAVFDLMYLIFNFTLSLKHRHNVKNSAWYNYYLPWAYPLADISSNTSVWLVVTFTIERYIAVCHPIRGKRWCTQGRAKLATVVVCIFSVLCTIPTFFERRTQVTVENGTEVKIVRTEYTELAANERFQQTYYWLTAVVFVFIPIVLLFIFNGFLVRSLKTAATIRRQISSRGTKSMKKAQQENKTTLMLVAVVLVFLICQLPSAVLLIMSNFIPHDDMSTWNLVIGLNNISNLLMAINASCNFILYSLLSRKFRQTFRTTFCSCVRDYKSHQRALILPYSDASIENTDVTEVNMYSRRVSNFASKNGRTIARGITADS